MIEKAGVPIPRGLADPKGNFGYLVDVQDLIHQLDLESGASLARSSVRGRPLALYDGALIGWAAAPGTSPAIRLFSAARQGDALQMNWETALPLPDWVELGSAEPGRFAITARVEGSRLVVTWEARTQYAGGAPPPAEVTQAQSNSTARTLRLDPGTGAVLSEETVAISLVATPELPQLSPGLFFVPYLQNGIWATQPWGVNGAEHYLVREASQPGILLVRRESPGADGEERMRLSSDPGAEAAVTPDGGLIFIHEPARPEQAWSIFSVRTGEPVTRLPYEVGTEDVAVLGNRVLYLVIEMSGGSRQLTLRCRLLDTGEACWAFPLGVETLGTPPPLAP